MQTIEGIKYQCVRTGVSLLNSTYNIIIANKVLLSFSQQVNY